MERGEYNNRRRIGSFKANINKYGERNLEGSAAVRKPHLEISEVLFLTTVESLITTYGSVNLIRPSEFLLIMYSSSSLKFRRSRPQ